MADMSPLTFSPEHMMPGTKRLQSSEIVQSSSNILHLSFSRSSTPANVGRRREYTASLLQSPARQGHTSRVASIFQNAAASLENIRNETYPSQTTRKNAGVLCKKPLLRRGSQRADSGAVCYPKLPSSLTTHPASLPLTNCREGPLIATPGNKTRLPPVGKETSIVEQPQSCETAKPSNLYQVLGRPKNPQFDWTTTSSSASSASWTGDSQFFRYPAMRHEVSPCEKNQGISKWMEKLPPTPDQHPDSEQPDSETERLEPLSPSVELERGSLRHRKREWEQRPRCASFDDGDIFS